MLAAYYELYPEDEPTMCGGCGAVYIAMTLHDGLCDRCWYADDSDAPDWDVA